MFIAKTTQRILLKISLNTIISPATHRPAFTQESIDTMLGQNWHLTGKNGTIQEYAKVKDDGKWYLPSVHLPHEQHGRSE